MNEPRIYNASGYWRTNISGGVLGGIGGALLLLVVFSIALWMTGFAREMVVWFVGICIILIGTALALYPGNLIFVYPLAVEVDSSKGIVLVAPWKRLTIPIADIRDMRNSFLHQGYVVRLHRRRKLLKSFVVHWLFGSEREPLARAIEGVLPNP